MPFNHLTESDKQKIRIWIGSQRESIADLDNILYYWNKAKSQHLFSLFGNQLILKKKVEIEKPREQLIRDAQQAYRDSKDYRNFLDKLSNIFRTVYGYGTEEWYALNNLTKITSPLEPYYNDRKLKITNINESKETTLTPGMKIQKAYKQLAQVYNLEEEYEAFRLECSRILNQKKLSGNLCISIHPLDYMTMSDNSYHWESCMSWLKGGSYRAGTIEMMNSPMVVVAYLEHNKPYQMSINGIEFEWQGNKKWRELFIVNETSIVGIKGYPYAQYEFQDIVLKWLRELAINNLHWNIPEEQMVYYDEDYDCRAHINGTTDYNIYFESNWMYNDFESDSTKHSGYLFNLENINPNQYHYINYSGKLNCMSCGVSFDIGDDGEEDRLFCYHCHCYSHYCVHCSDRVEDEYTYWVEDMPYCEYCFNEYCFTDDLSDEYYHNDDRMDVYLALIPDRPESDLGLYFSTHIDREDNIRQGYYQQRLFKDTVNSVHYDNNTGLYYLNLDEITDCGLSELYHYSRGHQDPNLLNDIQWLEEQMAD